MPEAVVTAPGWFGKLPALGDFASRRLPPAFVQALDAWLQQGLAAAVEARGADWLDLYLRARPRRFWIAAGLLERRAWSGVLAPSVDGVGRRFAFTVAAPAPDAQALLDAPGWGDAVEALARRLFDEGFGVADIERDIADFGPPPGDARAARAARGSLWWHGDRPQERLRFPALPPPAAFATLFAPDDLR
jgi:type VI secretion system protein ImpM